LAEVARAAKVSLPYLSEVERGRKEASSEVLAAVCDALRLELADVLTEAGRDLAARRDHAQRRDLAVRRDLGAGRSTVTALSQARRRATSLRLGGGDVLCRAA
jgi:transcriptional regulator with XRE-family HTH domain